ncbi:DUF3262 family protein [Photobacterium lutimaris]|nr:DUF3262 family protein [Photobacterium lutimaris]TDR72546.1 integrating conjugative element protein (TIGR03758 family) [Photobacterium lutimaris]
MRYLPLFVFSLFWFFPGFAVAEIMEPNPGLSNQQLWDSILGNGSFNQVKYATRGMTFSIVMFWVAWAAFGIYQQAFGKGKLDKDDALMYVLRLLLLLTISVFLITS